MHLASESSVKDRIRLVLYTPLEETFSFGFDKAIVFTGGDDPWVGRDKSRIAQICKGRRIPCTLIPCANHSLETADPFADLKTLGRIMRQTEAFLRHIQRPHWRRFLLRCPSGR